MSRRSSRSVAIADYPLALRHLIRAAELECPSGHAEALRDLTTLALRKIPSRGIFDPAARGEDDMFAGIESVARAHLELSAALAAFHAALDAARLSLAVRDDIARAALQVQSVSDTAHFYAGLAFGLTAVCVYRAA